MTKLKKSDEAGKVDSLDLQLIKLSDLLNKTILNDSMTSNSDQNSSHKSERSNFQNYTQKWKIGEANGELSGNGVALLQNTKDDNVLEIVIEKNFNYVGTLQELCVKKQLITPLYGVINVIGPPHCPTFQTFCEVGHYRQMATSANKKMGKQLAAAKVLECMKMAGPNGELSEKGVALMLNTKDDNMLEIASSKAIDEQFSEIAIEKNFNYVGALQELCVKKRLIAPLYGVQNVSGPPHCPIFQTFCEVGPHREIAISANKTMGKQVAAAKVLQCIKLDGDLPDYASNQSTLTNFTPIISNATSTITAIDGIDDINEAVAGIANPVGYLQEYCVKKRKTPPNYGIEKIEGASPPIFYTFCEVGQDREVVSSNSKKAGKALAARKIIMKYVQ